MKYKTSLVKEKLKILDNKMDIPVIDILSAISKIKKASDGVSVSTIVNCFKKAGYNGEDFFDDDSKDEINIY